MRRRAALGLLALLALAACGRRGPPRLPEAPPERSGEEEKPAGAEGGASG